MSRKTDKPTTSRKSRRATIAPHAVAAETPVAKAEPRVAEEAPRTISSDERDHMIAVRAFHLAAQRGFAPGGELEDWLTAEREVDRRIAR